MKRHRGFRDRTRCAGRETDVMIAVDPRYFRPAEVETLLGDPAKAHENWAGNRKSRCAR